MKASKKTNGQFVAELATLRPRIRELEASGFELKRAQEALIQGEEEFRAIVDNAPDQFVIMDREGTISFLNHALPADRLEDIIGTKIYDHMMPEIVDLYRQTVERIFQTCEPYRMEVRSVKDRIYDCRTEPLEQGDQVDHLIVILTDVTEHRQTEELLQRYRNDLENLVKERTASLEEANTALRVMLNTAERMRAETQESVLLNAKSLIIPYLEELKRTELDDRQTFYLDLLEQSLTRITQPFIEGLPAECLTLTPTELLVMNLVKEGKMTKDIAILLNMSQRTVQNHRYSIRTKLGLKNKATNLRAYLSSFNDVLDHLSIL